MRCVYPTSTLPLHSTNGNAGLKFHDVILFGEFLGGLFRPGQELYFDMLDSWKGLNQHHINLRQLLGMLTNEPVFCLEFAMAGMPVLVHFVMLVIVVIAFFVMCVFFVLALVFVLVLGIVFDICFNRGF